jgi:hypothetical protein
MATLMTENEYLSFISGKYQQKLKKQNPELYEKILRTGGINITITGNNSFRLINPPNLLTKEENDLIIRGLENVAFNL